MENEDIINKIDVTYLWGDQEPCFYYACKLAQEAYVNEEYRVFKAPFEEMRLWAQKHFWEDYAEEEYGQNKSKGKRVPEVFIQ